MSNAMQAEFDTVADWTADAALSLGFEHYLPAGFRGSGGPRTLEVLLDHLQVTAAHRMLDVGAGVGGPAAYARTTRGVRPLLVEPEAGACRAARRLYNLPSVRADVSTLPFADGSFDTVWSLGVLCTTRDHRRALQELRRLLATDGRLGLLVYVAVADDFRTPDGNNFPTPHSLHNDLEHAGLLVTHAQTMVPPGDEPPSWQQRVAAVRAAVGDRYGEQQAWQTAQEQAETMSALISEGSVEGRLLVLDAR